MGWADRSIGQEQGRGDGTWKLLLLCLQQELPLSEVATVITSHYDCLLRVASPWTEKHPSTTQRRPMADYPF